MSQGAFHVLLELVFPLGVVEMLLEMLEIMLFLLLQHLEFVQLLLQQLLAHLLFQQQQQQQQQVQRLRQQ